MSIFAISGVKETANTTPSVTATVQQSTPEEPPTTIPTEAKISPGFEIVALVGAILAIYIVKRRA